jgi:hypothetical protein
MIAATTGDGGKNWRSYSYRYNDYRYVQKPHYQKYGYWKYRPYPWWFQFQWQPRWY